jgi:hypothetical protein
MGFLTGGVEALFRAWCGTGTKKTISRRVFAVLNNFALLGKRKRKLRNQ